MWIKGLLRGRPGSLIPVAALGLWRTSSIGLLLAAGIWAGIAPPALASILAYNYSATPDEGPLAGQKHSDIFSYDDLNPRKVQDFVAPLTFSFSRSGQTGYKPTHDPIAVPIRNIIDRHDRYSIYFSAFKHKYFFFNAPQHHYRHTNMPAVPLPAALPLLATALCGLAIIRWRGAASAAQVVRGFIRTF